MPFKDIAPSTRLTGKIITILVIKLTALFAIHQLWFNHSTGWSLPPEKAAGHVLSSPNPVSEKEHHHGDR